MEKTTKKTRTPPKQPPREDVAATYDEFKEFEGRKYTGMKIGRGHKWHYDQGTWTETKITPEEWRVEYNVTKRRVGKAPEGSGVPVGTGYHWYILAHQNVTKLNANDYSTSLRGMKFKLAHRRADKGTWSASTQAQRKHMVKILQAVIEDLEKEIESDAKRPMRVSGTKAVAPKPARVLAKMPARGRRRRG